MNAPTTESTLVVTPSHRRSSAPAASPHHPPQVVRPERTPAATPHRVVSRETARTGIPLWIKLAYSAFMAVLVPVYWSRYGATNFLYFCDVALFLTLVGLWRESRLLLSMAAVGILLPQALWCADFAAHLGGFRLTGMTDYMFDSQRSLFLRGLSLFHGWLPFLLVYAVIRVGYDSRAWPAWTALAWGLCLVCYFWMPPAAPEFAGKLVPNNINYVWGFDDAQPQTWLPAPAYLAVWMGALGLLVYTPSHLVLRRWARQDASSVGGWQG